MTESLWMANTGIPSFESLKEDSKTHVLIIGGGMAGLMCAYWLDKAGVDYALVESGRIAHGVTGRTTAKITAQHGLIYDKLLKSMGTERAKMVLQANLDAVDEFRNMVKNIDCDFESKNSYVYSRRDKEKLIRETAALNKLGCRARFIEHPSIPLQTVGAVMMPDQAQFDPLKFIAGIASRLRIYENTLVREFAGRRVVTSGGTITADKIIVTTHFPLWNKHGSYFLKMYQHRSYVLALEGAADVDGMYVDEAEKGLSFRSARNLLLLGGGSHRTGKEGGAWAELSAFAHIHYPGSRIQYRWATQDCMTLDGLPYIGRYSAGTPNLYVATGFNKWGMTSSMAAGKILSDMVTGQKNPYAPVFHPSRSILKPQLAVNAFEAVTSLATPSPRRCPHLGCALKRNGQEHSWDCPCHGSRFDSDGKRLNGPATGDLKI